MENDKNLITYFKSFREEINTRIEQHSQLLINKFWICGLLLYVLYTTNFKVVPFLVAVCFDFIIFHNIRLLNRCGKMIKKLESDIFGSYKYEEMAQSKSENIKDLIDRVGWLGFTILMLIPYWIN